MGLYDRALESTRQSIDCPQARRNFSLELCFDREPDVGRRIGFHRRFGAEEIEIASDHAANVERDIKRLEVGIGRLDADTIFAVLHDWIVNNELARRRVHVVGAKAFVVKIASDAKLPIIIWVVNQSGFRKHALVYNPNDDWEFRIAGNLYYESFRTDNVYTPARKLVVHDPVVQYSEDRVGVQATYSHFKPFDITLDVGCMIRRDFDFFRAEAAVKTDPAPYVRFAVEAKF